jgi:molecular chaperone HtpG
MTKAQLSTATTHAARKPKRVTPATSDMITIGKDVLELLSSAMYVDPLTIYREYIQNAADAIDEMRAIGDLTKDDRGTVEITIDPGERTIKIRDNGSGIAANRAAATLLSIGASGKRGTAARGFRGVGRLAGLAYCRQLTFRTRARGDDRVTEVIWDCLKLKSTLRDVTQTDDLPGVMQRIIAIADIDGVDFPEHFFEVELSQVVRLRKDVLLNAQLVEAYLAQVAPVPFASDFSHAAAINRHVAAHARLADLKITIGVDGMPITRPHRDVFAVSDTVQDQGSELELLTFQGDNGVSAVGWILHHSYLGHISVKSQIGGLRLRAGNVQVGGHDLVEEVFPEPRFNGWSIGEIHVVDRLVLPNARRDHFEQNIHFSNLTAELGPYCRSIAKRCRAASVERHREREARIKAAAFNPTANSTPADVVVAQGQGQARDNRGEGREAVWAAGPTPLTPPSLLMTSDLSERFASLLAQTEASKAEASAAFAMALAARFD